MGGIFQRQACTLAGAVLFLLLLSSCEEYEICGKGNANNCCAIKTGESESISYCVADCRTCLEEAGGGIASCPAEKSGWKDVYTNEGCLTGKRRKRSIFGLAPAVEEPSNISTSPVLLVSLSNNPLDCMAVCQDAGSAFCSTGAVAPEVSRQLRNFENGIRSVNEGQISMARVHHIFGIQPGADTCRRGPISLTTDTIRNDGPRECRIGSVLGIGGKDVAFEIEIPSSLRGKREASGSSLTVDFPDRAHSARLFLSDPNLQAKYGGNIDYVRVAEATAYFATENSCIKLSLP
jgi:hypothetical protein